MNKNTRSGQQFRKTVIDDQEILRLEGERLERFGGKDAVEFVLPRADRLREKLSSAYLEYIILNPKGASEKYLPERLWWNVYYPGQVKLWRKQLLGKSTEVEEARASLECAAQFYRDLVKLLIDKLLLEFPIGDQENMNAFMTSASPSKQKHLEESAAVVDCLHRLYCNLGDLLRYSSKLQEAKDAYKMAADLAPGYGNAMGKLGVCLAIEKRPELSPRIWIQCIRVHEYTTDRLRGEDIL